MAIFEREQTITALLARCVFTTLLFAATMVGCVGLFGPRTIVVSDAELSQRLAARFPIERRWLEIFDLRLSNPQVSSHAPSGRLRVEVDIRLGQRLTGTGTAARLLLFARPRYEPSDHSIRITDIKLDALRIDGGAESLLGRGAAWPSAMLAQALEDRTIYQFNARQLADLERQGLVLRNLEVGERGLTLNFDPA
ncbi:MAG: hypothetical protein ABI564_04055 [Ideonella sp.]